MSQVEDVPLTSTGSVEDVCRPFPDNRQRRHEGDRIQVSLNSSLLATDPGPGIVQICAPVSPDDISSPFAHEGQQIRRTCPKVD